MEYESTKVLKGPTQIFPPTNQRTMEHESTKGLIQFSLQQTTEQWSTEVQKA